MSGPWEAFQAKESGPWGAYRKPEVGASPVDPAQAAKDAMDGMSPIQKVLANLGAGLDTAYQGAKQLVGAGPDDAAVREKRARDQALADNTTGGSALQFGAEILPGFALPGGAVVRGAQGAVNALRGIRAATPIAARLGGIAATADAAGAGALMGAATLTTDDESKLFNTVAGAVGGALLPGLIAGGRSIRDLLTRGGAEAKAAERLVQAVGGPQEAEAVLAKLRAYKPGPVTKDIPMDVAEITQNPALGREVRTAQARRTEDWAPFRKAQHDARYEALQRATAGADDLASATQARSAATDPLRAKALAEAAGNDYTTPVEAAVVWMREGKAGANPAVQSITDYVGRELKNPNMSPERLYEVRKTLTEKLNGKTKIGDELGAATKTARRETMALVQAIDDALDGATGGKWTPYLKEYANKSGEVDSAKAQALIRKAFDRPGASQTSDIPDVTGFRLGKTVEKAGENAYGSTLDAGAKARVGELRDNLDMSEGLQKLLRFTGTSGGGSNTAMDLPGVMAAAAENKLTNLVPVLKHAIQRSDAMTQAAMSDALRDPQRFIAGVSRKLEQRRPLTRSEESVLALLRSAGSAGTLELAESR
jgi:hypothetical protein